MSHVTIDTIEAREDTLYASVNTSPDLARFVSGEPFETTYDRSIEDVPAGILAIPVLAHVCPVAWTRGADVHVESVDATFARALEDVKASLLSMYDFLQGGRLHARERTTHDPIRSGRDESDPVGDGLLFTGGVDSTCAYVRRRDEIGTLVGVRGWTITPRPSDDRKWAAFTDRVSRFAANRDLEATFVESNMLEFLDEPMLLAHFKRHVDGGWYSSVGHGLGLLSLCAPIAYASGIEDLHVAATHWDGVDLEWGSRPDIDDHVRWSETECHHADYDLSRQERIDRLAEYVETDSRTLELQTCNARMDGNCGRCEKCFRTAIGLRLSGLDPTDHGYPFDDAAYEAIRQSFEAGEWIIGEDERLMWADIRDRARRTDPATPAERSFFTWLKRTDLEDLVESGRPPLSDRLLRALARNTPTGVYRSMYPIWDGASTWYRSRGDVGR